MITKPMKLIGSARLITTKAKGYERKRTRSLGAKRVERQRGDQPSIYRVLETQRNYMEIGVSPKKDAVMVWQKIWMGRILWGVSL